MYTVRSRGYWLVTCSCGWGRECISRWAAEGVVKLHPRLSVPGIRQPRRLDSPDGEGPPSRDTTSAERNSTLACRGPVR